MPAQVGDKAPDFELPATGSSEKVSLSDYRGRPVVLLFYPLDFSGTCTTELCGVRDSLHDYEELGAAVLAVSIDSIFAHKAWASQQGFKFPLLSDLKRETAQKFEVLDEERGFAKRSAFVIDGDGIIRYRSVSDDPGVIPDFDAVRAAVRKAS